LSLRLYSEARIIVSYEYSNDVTGSVVPKGTSIATLTSTQTKTIFETEQNDEFNVTITIRYSMPIEQTIPLVIYSAGEILATSELPVYAQTLVLRFTVVTTAKPEYPTPKDVMQETIPAIEEQSGKVDYMNKWLGALTFVVLVNLLVSGVDFWLRLRRPIG